MRKQTRKETLTKNGRICFLIPVALFFIASSLFLGWTLAIPDKTPVHAEELPRVKECNSGIESQIEIMPGKIIIHKRNFFCDYNVLRENIPEKTKIVLPNKSEIFPLKEDSNTAEFAVEILRLPPDWHIVAIR